MHRKAYLLLLIPLMAMWWFPPSATAGPDDGNGRKVRGPRSLDSVVSELREDMGARILSAETRMVNGREVHYVRILSNRGRVMRLQVDAQTGRRLNPPRRR